MLAAFVIFTVMERKENKMEIERKFLIDWNEVTALGLPEVKSAQSWQGYLSAATPVVRIRRRDFADGHTDYILCIKGKGKLAREEIEKELGIDTYPVNWPIGSGKEFLGVYDRNKQEILHFSSNTNAKKSGTTQIDLDDPVLIDMLGQTKRDQLIEDIELLDVAGDPFSLEQILSGELTPMFFGSASNNFGVEPFLHRVVGQARLGADDGRINLVAVDAALSIQVEVDRHGEAVLVGTQRAQVVREPLGQHRDHAIGQIGAGRPVARVEIDGAPPRHVGGHVRDMDPEPPRRNPRALPTDAGEDGNGRTAHLDR